MKEINEKSPKVIAAKIEDQFHTKGYFWDILYLHIPNEHDRLRDHHYFYYDCGAEEVDASMVLDYIVLEQ